MTVKTQNDKKKIVLLHVPKINRWKHQIYSYSCMVTAMGLLSIADIIEKANHQVTIINLGIEKKINPTYNAHTLLTEEKPDFIGISLHWHYQSFDTIEFARQLKDLAPTIPIVLGGLTASAFAVELLSMYTFIDFVVKGDGEKSLVPLLEAASDPSIYQNIPNLVYRKNNSIKISEIQYTATDNELQGQCFSRLDLFKHHEYHSWSHSYTDVTPLDLNNYPEHEGDAHSKDCFLYIGRGCQKDCVFCGGSATGYKHTSARNGIALRPIDDILNDITQFVHTYNKSIINISFDAPFFREHGKHFLDLFYAIQNANLDIGCEFTAWEAPITLDVLDIFSKTFNLTISKIWISVHTTRGESYVQHTDHLYAYPQLNQIIEYIRDNNIPFCLYNHYLPWETTESIVTRSQFNQYCKNEIPTIQFGHEIPELEPASKWQLHPEKYPFHIQRTTFRDYYSYHKNFFYPHTEIPKHPGYDFPMAKPIIFYAKMKLDEKQNTIQDALLSLKYEDQISLIIPGTMELQKLKPWLPSEQKIAYLFLNSIYTLDDLWKWLAFITYDSFGLQVIECMLLDHYSKRTSYPNDQVLPITYYDMVRYKQSLPEEALSPSFNGNRANYAFVYAQSEEDIHLMKKMKKMKKIEKKNKDKDKDKEKLCLDQCRWNHELCPAVQGKRLFLNPNAKPYICFFGPALEAFDYVSLQEVIHKIFQIIQTSRGCHSCPIRNSCSKCVFTAPFKQEEFCRIMQSRYMQFNHQGSELDPETI